jgi:hypothetical protein
MGDWNRTSKECTLESFRAENIIEIKKHLDTYNLGPILDNSLMCVETVSDKKKKGLFGGGDSRVVVSIVLTPRWLVWAVSGDKTGTGVLSAQLRDASITDYASSEFYKMVPDNGIQVTAAFTGTLAGSTAERGTMFIPLGDESVAQRFKEMVIKAAQESKK